MLNMTHNLSIGHKFSDKWKLNHVEDTNNIQVEVAYELTYNVVSDDLCLCFTWVEFITSFQ
jgi:hypothetical protein